MADSTPAYLEGGPCDGTTRDLTPAEADSATLVCKGGLYKAAYPPQHRKGAIVFGFAGKAPTGGGAIKAAKAHGGWSDVRRSVNRNLPRSLSRSQRNTRAALQALHRARRVRI